jgi:glycosyltransferase involved in cell wall biosynthesis
MMSPAPVSAVVPLFNGRRFIRAAVESILTQELRPREIILVDDGSSDGGAETLADCPDLRIVRQPNGGEAAARNRGIGEASQPLIAFLDQDDIWLPTKLKAQMAALGHDPSIDIVFGPHRLFAEDGARWFRQDLLDKTLVARLPGTLLVRRSVFERIGLFREDMKLGSDVDWTWRAGDAGMRFHSVAETVLLRRLHGANASMDMPQFILGLLKGAGASLGRKQQGAISGSAGATPPK